MGRYRMVVIGSSSGGLHALQVILNLLPAKYPLAVAIVQHRLKGTDNVLADILGTHCSLPVVSVLDKDDIHPGTIYIAPPDYHLLVENGYFALSSDMPVWFARPSIDVLFESAAEVYGKQVIGVILTGSSRDGADGLAAVKRHGGLAVVQDPASSESSAMPESAISATTVDHVLPLEAIGMLLAAFGDMKTR